MKRITALALVFALLLCGCGAKQEEAPQLSVQTTEASVETTTAPTEATTEPTTEPTEAPTEPPIPRNPLNGEILDEPFTGRVFANTVSNLQENLPHVGVIHADMIIETFVNMNNVIRCLALFTDIESVEAIGSTRSTRPIFNDIAQHYDLIVSHAGGSGTALEDARNRGIDNFNIDSWVVQEAGASYRDKEYKRSYENTLFGIGSGIKAYAEAQGIPMELEKDYGFRFTEDGTPAEGEIADKVTLNFIYGRAKKETVMVYNAKLDKYVWNQYGKEMTDQITGDIEAFTNVIIMQAEITNNGIYHAADFCAGGTGYYANGGILVPIYWTCADEDSAFEFFTNDGEPLELGVGNTYIAICSYDSEITYEEVIPPETEPPTEAPTEPAETVEETISETAAETSAETLSIDETEDCAG